MNRESTRKRRVQKTLGLHYSRFYVIALCIDSRFRHKILENCSQAAPVEKVGVAVPEGLQEHLPLRSADAGSTGRSVWPCLSRYLAMRESQPFAATGSRTHAPTWSHKYPHW